jgi:thymidylate synthase
MNWINTNYVNAQAALVNMLSTVLADGVTEVVRGNETKELTNVTLTIKNPAERCFILPKRNDNIFHKIAETLWVLAGRNDMEFLVRYLPRAVDFSDDGRTWRAAYGARLRNWGHAHNEVPDFLEVDQVKQCASLLHDDPQTRRAVMSLWDPASDYGDYKDIPCNNWIHWLIRHSDFVVKSSTQNKYTSQTIESRMALRMNVAQRSSDILWGFSGINTFEWSVLHMMMAYWAGVDMGPLTYFISSFHLYSRHYDRAISIVEHYKGGSIYDYGVQPAGGFNTRIQDLDWQLNQVFKILDAGIAGRSAEKERGYLMDPFLTNCLQMLELYNVYLDWKRVDNTINTDVQRRLAYMLDAMPDNDFKLAAVEHFGRKFDGFNELVDLSPELRRALEFVLGD